MGVSKLNAKTLKNLLYHSQLRSNSFPINLAEHRLSMENFSLSNLSFQPKTISYLHLNSRPSIPFNLILPQTHDIFTCLTYKHFGLLYNTTKPSDIIGRHILKLIRGLVVSHTRGTCKWPDIKYSVWRYSGARNWHRAMVSVRLTGSKLRSSKTPAVRSRPIAVIRRAPDSSFWLRNYVTLSLSV